MDEQASRIGRLGSGPGLERLQPCQRQAQARGHGMATETVDQPGVPRIHRGQGVADVETGNRARRTAQRLRTRLAAHPSFHPGALEMEVLETSALEDLARVSQVIEACREIGIGFALDDFGTGYSSLTYLKRLSVAQLKIDQSFVRDMLDDPDDLAILGGVLGLASALHRQVIAEGVESAKEDAFLTKNGVNERQGFLFAKPMPAAAFERWYRRHLNKKTR